MSFQKTALRKGNLPPAFQGPNKQYFFLMDSAPPDLAAVPKSDSLYKERTNAAKDPETEPFPATSNNAKGRRNFAVVTWLPGFAGHQLLGCAGLRACHCGSGRAAVPDP